ncbi:MAG: NAD-dependent epimerase/dehydratase family protein, partial [Gallionella sp.]
EEYLLTGPLEATNRPYALAKIAGIEMCWSYNRQYGTTWLAAMPTNLYGPGDNYDLNNSHVLPALVRKMHEAKKSGAAEVILWGSGKPMREFLYVDDLANALVFLATLDDQRYNALVAPAQCPLINVGTGTDLTIRELAETIATVVGYKGKFVQDTSKPDGTMRKTMDVRKIQGLGWKATTSLKQGIALTYKSFSSQNIEQAQS